jgi:hypothetical protein
MPIASVTRQQLRQVPCIFFSHADCLKGTASPQQGTQVKERA